MLTFKHFQALSAPQKTRNAVVTLLAMICLVSPVDAPAASASSPEEKARLALKLAQEKSGQREYAEAIQLATVAIRLDPTDLDAYRVRGMIECLAGYYLDAVKDLTVALKEDSQELISNYKLRAESLLAMGEAELAIADYTRALKRAPGSPKLLYYRARAYALLGKKEHALRDIEEGTVERTHFTGKLEALRNAVLTGAPVPKHAPCSN